MSLEQTDHYSMFAIFRKTLVMPAMFQNGGAATVTGALTDVASKAQEEMQAMLTALMMVPDFVRLGNFPDHCSGPVCWCHPRIVVGIRGFIVFHKDLGNGEFDS